jgi:hypothetical protein
MIQNAMRQIQFSVNLSKSSKSQALDVIRKLKDVMPITRASMLIRLVYDVSDQTAIASEIDKVGGQIVQKSPSVGDSKESYVDVKIDPEYYRRMEEFVRDLGFGRVEVIQMRMAGAVAPSPVSALALLSGVEGVVPQESKEGDDVYPPDRVEPVADTAVRNSKPKVPEKEKSGKSGRGKNNGDDLEGLLAEVGLKDLRDESDDSFDEYEVVPMPKSSKKKNKKAKVAKVNDDSNDEGSEGEEATQDASVADSTVTNVSTPMSILPTANSAKQKIGKKDKRLEKDLQRQREEEAKLLQERILRQKKEQKQVKEDAARSAKTISENVSGAESTSNGTEAATTVPVPSSTAALDVGASASTAATAKAQSCNTCGGIFYDSKLYRDHFKSDWHRFNLKRKMKNLPAVTSEEEFMNLPLSDLQL